MIETVKYRTVSIPIYPWRHSSGREYFRFKRADGKHTTRATIEKARAAAKEHAQATHKGTLDLETLTPEQVRAMKRMIEADPTCRLVDEFLVWHGRRAPKKLLGEALDEFLATKQQNRGRSAQNVKTLNSRLTILKPLRSKMLCDISPVDLVIRSTIAPRTRVNIRGSVVTFFLWCVERGYLHVSPGDKTAAERIEKPISRRKIPATYTPDQFRICMEAVIPKFLPWLACGGLAGIRTDELHPLPGGEKDPLRWEDFKWERDIIVIRPETDKNGHGRVVPILPSLRLWLHPVSQETGPLISCLPSSGNDPETTRLGKLIGGWKSNALRHSYISYRAATEGLAKTAMECGNSESEAKRSYNNAKSPDEAADWFSTGISCKLENTERTAL